MNSKQEEAEKLMNSILPLAERMLREYGEFCPYGGYMRPDGQIVEVGVQDVDSDRPKSKDLIYVLQRSFRELAAEGKCKAVALIADVLVETPQSSQKTDAIQVSINHVDGYSREVFVPYQIVDGELVYGETFAQLGRDDVFR